MFKKRLLIKFTYWNNILLNAGKYNIYLKRINKYNLIYITAVTLADFNLTVVIRLGIIIISLPQAHTHTHIHIYIYIYIERARYIIVMSHPNK